MRTRPILIYSSSFRLPKPKRPPNWNCWSFQLHSKGQFITTIHHLQEQIHRLKHTDSICKTFLVFNYRISTCWEHKLPRKSSSETLDPFYLHLHSLPSPKDFCSKTTHSEYQTQRKRKSVIGRTCSTTAQAYSLSFLPHFASYLPTLLSPSLLLSALSNLFSQLLPAIFPPLSSCWLLLQASISHSVPFRSSSPT